MIPEYLLSPCADKTEHLCYGCDQAAKQDPDSGQWFITMGHPGFNHKTNNRGGFKTYAMAIRTVNYYATLKRTRTL